MNRWQRAGAPIAGLLAGAALAFGGCGLDDPLVFGVIDGGSDAGGPCDGGAGCQCEVDSRHCVPDAPGVEQVCVAGEAGAALEVRACEAGAACVDGKGCFACDHKCEAGEVACGPDDKTVLHCEETPGGCLDFVAAVSCPSEGMASCVLPEGGGALGDLKSYCVNECGGRGIPLAHKQCEPHDKLPCAVWACDTKTGALEPDHKGCLAGGLPCSEDAECASCSCQEGVCIGNMANACIPSCQ